MDVVLSIVLDILFITKHKSDHNVGPNLNIDKLFSVKVSPGSSREAKKDKRHFRIKWVKCNMAGVGWGGGAIYEQEKVDYIFKLTGMVHKYV